MPPLGERRVVEFGGGNGFPPVTTFVLVAQALSFLVNFFLGRGLMDALDFDLRAWPGQPWTALTYPLHATQVSLGMLLLCYVFYWVASGLERRWGSAEFGLFLAGVTALGALSHAVAGIAFGLPVLLSGLGVPLAAVFVAWCMLNPDASVLVFFVLPVRALWLGWASLALLYFSTGPVLGLFALAAPLGAWWYARRGRQWLRRLRVARAEAAPVRVRRRGWRDAVLHPIKTWRRRRQIAEFKALMVERGLRDPGADDRPN